MPGLFLVSRFTSVVKWAMANELRPFRAVVSNGEDFRSVEGVARAATEFENSLALDENEWPVTVVETN